MIAQEQSQGSERLLPRSRIVPFTLTFFALIAGMVILIQGRDLLIPFAMAILVWFLLNATAGQVRRISLGGRQVPRWAALAVAILIVGLGILVMVEIITATISDMSGRAAIYQANLDRLLKTAADLFNLDLVSTLGDLLAQVDLQSAIGAVLSALSGLAGDIGVTLICVLFLLVEQQSFDAKIKALIPSPEKESKARRLFARMAKQIRTYLAVKTVMAVIAAILTYAVLVSVGLDFAVFWAFLTFLTYYIPTIGGIVALLFPVAFALIQFNSFGPALVILLVAGGLQIAISNVVEPRFMSRSLNLSALVIIISLFVWGTIWGVAGMFLCVPITVIVAIVLSNFEQTRPFAIAISSDGVVSDPA